MGYGFDTPVDRTGGDSTKWAKYATDRHAGRDVIPLWVADMDFAAPPPVIEALRERVDHGVFGYNQPTGAQTQSVLDYLERHFDYRAEAEWIVWLPGLVSGLNVACRSVGEPGSAVFTATPIYPPFLSSPRFSGRRVVTAPLVLPPGGADAEDAGWQWSFPTVNAVLGNCKAKLFLLCHPHNPVGRAWHDDELWQIAALAEKYDVVVCSDEIHNGLILAPDREHALFAGLAPEIAERTITLMAPSKTFNIPGLGCAFAIISNDRLRRDFRTAMHGIVPHANALGMAATAAALTRCDDWHAALIDYLRSNARAVERCVNGIEGLSMAPVEATYLAWIDAGEFCRARGIESAAKYFEQHGLGLSDGADFGTPGFVRLNFGTRRVLLDEALERLRAACA